MKSSTDLHWNERAARIENDIEVNIMDIFQRELEYDYVCRYLQSDMRVLEVGCGNGFSTNRFRSLVRHIDAFDYADNMIARARERFGETNNSFIHDNALAPKNLGSDYDAAICVRVLINLRNLDEQRRALSNIARLVRANGLLILVEGFTEGFAALSDLRRQVDLPPLEPAKINFYSSVNDLMPDLEADFTLEDQFHLGAYDYLTRVMYPLVVGPDNAKHNSVFSERCQELARAFNPDCFAGLSRVRGLILRKRS
jgi:ubiquinone/menaquinone biosynthesis C-methylase UbiE